MREDCYIFDIDGTIADCSHRLHLIQSENPKWDAFHAACEADSPISHMLDICESLSVDICIIFVTGRPECSRAATIDWLKRHLPDGEGWDWSEDFSRDLYMRRDGDHRHDYVVKSELLDRIIADGYRPLMAFEDRKQVVKMWRERGIPCAQVAEGDY